MSTRRPTSRLAAILALFGVLTVAAVAVPVVAVANESGGESALQQTSGVAECEERAAGEHPRLESFFNSLVEDGVISPEQLAEIDVRLDERHFQACVARLIFPRGTAIDAAAEITGTERREVLGALVTGESLATYAAEHGVDEAALVAAIMVDPTAEAAELVASGELDQATADTVLAAIEARVAECIQMTDIQPRRQRGWPGLLGALGEL